MNSEDFAAGMALATMPDIDNPVDNPVDNPSVTLETEKDNSESRTKLNSKTKRRKAPSAETKKRKAKAKAKVIDQDPEEPIAQSSRVKVLRGIAAPASSGEDPEDHFTQSSNDEDSDHSNILTDDAQATMIKTAKTTPRKRKNSPSDPTGSTPPKTPKRSKAVKGQPRLPSSAAKRDYGTSKYQFYDSTNPPDVQPVLHSFVKLGDYNRYSLYVNPYLDNVSDVPTSRVRIDDLTISRIIEHFKPFILSKNWPADLDKASMVRATRMPLGNAAKVWVNAEDIDVEGNTASQDQEGYYYRWWRGLHCLCGDEGLQADVYRIRPSFEKFLTDGFGFKLSCKAKVQLPKGVDEDMKPRGDKKDGKKGVKADKGKKNMP